MASGSTVKIIVRSRSASGRSTANFVIFACPSTCVCCATAPPTPLVFLDMPAMQQPEAYIGGAATMFAADGAIANDATRQFVEKFITAFAKWVEAHAVK